MMKHVIDRLVTAGLLLMGLLVSSQSITAQKTWSEGSYVPISINSGNPTFPYPQFLEYAKGKTLAKYNAEGVTHADMEKTGREAYEIMSHRCRYEGGTHCGVPYITFNDFRKFGTDEMPQGGAEFCTEGDGYMLLAAAIFADQPTFNGMWMWIHDNRLSKVKKYSDGTWLRKGYEKDGRLVCKDPEGSLGLAGCYCIGDETATGSSVGAGNTHSAADGDYDIAMAVLIAYKQWGEFMYQDGKQVFDADGNPISYKQIAEDYIKALVDTVPYYQANDGVMQGNGVAYNGFNGYLTGDIGVDGYSKSGNTWGEQTNWRSTQTLFDSKLSIVPSMGGGGGTSNYVDYSAPSYFNEFAYWLENGDGEGTEWQINQFKRAEASCDWVIGQLYAQGAKVACAGNYSISDDNKVTFSSFNSGEDFRYAWRTILNYVWHGNPTTTWDPTSHTVKAGGNTFEHDMAMNHAEFMKEPGDGTGVMCSKMGASPDPGQPSWSGPSQIQQSYFLNGGIQMKAGSNYALGCSAPAAVASEDVSFIADMYRQSELVWDDASGESKNLTDDERYILSMPKYFHGWFRCLGLLTNSGNLHAPRDMKPMANVKVYMSVDKTYAYQGDDVTYGVQFRNYGTLDAEGTTITTKLDPNYDFVSATKGGKYNASTHSITWSIGSIPGFKTGGLAATMDSVFFTVNVRDTLNKRICLTSTISGSNFDDWVSNEYPNHATYTMERNCVDILASRSLFVKKTANRTSLNPKDVVTFTVEFGNESKGEDSWMNGGRDNVRISYGTHLPTGGAYQFYSFYRFWNDSYEAYINMSNYRVSYFMYDAAAIGLYDATKNKTGWTFVVDNQTDMDKYGYNPETGPITFAYQKIPQGSDEHGKWNQRLMIRFADVLMAPSTHVYDKLDSKYLLHKGVYGPGYIRARLASNPAQDLSTRVTDDWSFDASVGESSVAGQDLTFTLISPCWANYDDPGYVIDNYSRHVCNPTSVGNYGRVLVEEFDGYTWRRIQGTGPLPGKEAYNVTIADTIPYELEWVGWVDSTALKDDEGNKIQATYTAHSGKDYTGIVYWTIPTMLVGEKDKLVYKCKARDLGCPDVEDTYYKNVAWIWSDTDSPDSSQVDLMTTCAELPPVIEPQTALTKVADKKSADQGSTVGYTVSFKNTVGTRVDANCKSTTGWQTLGSGSLPAIGSEGLKLSTNGSTAYFFGPEKSYGKDGSVYATIGGSPSSTQALYIVFRYKSGTPGQSDFKGICMQLMVNKDGKNNFGYYLYNDATLIASEGLTWADAMQFPGDNDAPTFKFVLNGDHLYMYVNDQEDEWTNVSKDWEGLTSAGPGYFGMYVNSNGNSNTQLTSFITELDYAFDITLYDQLPDELGNITDISDKGTWDETKNLITWPTVATTPETSLAPGDSIGYTFTAEVVSCDKYINNYGLATVYGQDTLKVLNTIECGASTCPLEKVTLKADAETFCETDSTVIRATATSKGDYYYQWYKDKKEIGEPVLNQDTLVVKAAGSYKVVAMLSTDATETCTAESKAIDITVDTIPATILKDTSACPDTDVELPSVKKAEDTYTYEWSDGSTDETLTVSKEGTYSVVVTNGTCVAKDTAKVSFEGVTLGDGIFTLNTTEYDRAVTDTGSICPNTTATLMASYESDDNKYEWSSKPEDPGMKSDGSNTITIAPTETTTYYVNLTKGCAAVDSFVVTIGGVKLSGGVFTLNDMEYDRAKTDTGSICPNTTATLAVNYKADGDAYEWSSKPEDANMKSDGSNTVTIAPTEMTTYYVRFKQECDAIDSFVVTIGGVKLSGGSFTLNTTEYPRSEGNSGSVCPNTESTLTVSYKSDDGNYTWSSEPKDETMSASGATVTISPKEKTMYFVDFVLGCAARDSFEVTIGEPMKVTVKTDTLCNSLKLTASTEDSEKATFTWTKDGETSTANPLEIDGTTDPSGKVSVVATATDACESEPIEVSYQNVDMTVKIDGSATVCPGKTASLAAVVETTGLESEPEYTYSWSDGTAEVSTEATYAAPAGSYSLTVSNGYCEKSATHEITEGTGEVKGDLTINDTKIVGSGAERTYGSCGGDLVIVADYTHDAGTDFTWTVNGETQSATGNTITISPKEATTVTIDFMNECAAHDEFTITMLDSVKLTTEETRKCGSTTLSVSSNVAGATYTWTNGTEETSGKSLTIDLAQAPTAGGSVKVQGTAAGYCDSKIEEVTYLIDTLGVTLAGPETVCDGATAALTATAATSNADATITYSYASRKAGSTTAFAPVSGTTAELTTGALTEDTEFQVTADNGTCTATATWTVKIGIPTRDGQLTVDGQATTLTDNHGTKTYRTCGDADIALAVSHTGEDYVWTKDGASVGEGASVSVTPATATNHVETYIVTYTNQCPVSDTVNVEVYPLAATADWSLVDGKEYCEGADASATLTLTNYDATLTGSYIKWFKDGAEITAANGQTTLSLTGLKTTDAGTYTYEVSNGICTRPTATDAATMKVDAKLHLSVATDEMIVAKGEAASVEVTADPASTTLTWYDDATGTRTSAGTGNPLALASVDRDYQLTAVGEAENYCPDSVKVSVLADAKAVVALSAEAPYICYTGGDVLTIDTTGTGTVRFPAKYRISLQESADGTTYTEIANNVTTYKVSPTATTSYKAVVTYGDQTAESEVVTVNFYPAATFTVDAPTKVCTGTEAQINLIDLLPADAEVVWNSADGISGSGTSATATPTQTSVYGYSIQQNGGLCVENFSVGIITVDQLELYAQDTTICAGGSATLHAVASQTPDYYKWFIGDSLVSEKATLFAKPTETTTYKVRVSNGYCDSVEVSATVTVSELPVIDTVISMAARQVQVVAHGGMEPYEYAVKPHDYSDSELVDLTTYGRHTFMVRDQYGCVGTKDVTIDAPEIKVPEIVTNNGDGINDDFTVPGLAEAYPDATISIYDRWGKKLVEYSASEGSWDGTYNGKKMPSTDYWYEIWIPELYKYYTGHFTLLND